MVGNFDDINYSNKKHTQLQDIDYKCQPAASFCNLRENLHMAPAGCRLESACWLLWSIFRHKFDISLIVCNKQSKNYLSSVEMNSIRYGMRR